MEPVKIRGTWRWTDEKGRYRRGTDEQYKAFLDGRVIEDVIGEKKPLVLEEPVVDEQEEEAPSIEEVYNDGLFDTGDEPA
ncbi:MAG: hypothetical protein ACO387_03500 [Flavobacteriaceae bacterium]